MSKLTIAGIRLENQFSPNHIGNDAAIFSLTVQHLRDLGCEVNEYIESDLIIHQFEETAIFNMVRNWTSIHKLQQMEDQGYTVINSGYGIENCTREKMTRLLMSNNISHPASLILPTDEDPTAALEKAGFYNCWIKRGDFHAIHREDVTYVRNPEEAKTILKEYALRGIKTAVVKHHSKFGLEQINGTAKGIPFDDSKLQQLCSQAAEVLNIHIYGGDCIISDDGSIRLIDFNDWPSFAPCRDEAAPQIARRIYNLISK